MTTARSLARTALFTALLCVLAAVTIPLGPVPITLQTLGVYAAGLFLPPAQAALAALAYLLLGAAGLPVFAGFSGGIGVVAGPAGGFLFGFIPAAAVISRLSSASSSGLSSEKDPSLPIQITALICGCVIIHLAGLIQLTLVGGSGWRQALAAGVLPFLPAEAAKAALALFLRHRIHRV